jgi:hypothetical protein
MCLTISVNALPAWLSQTATSCVTPLQTQFYPANINYVLMTCTTDANVRVYEITSNDNLTLYYTFATGLNNTQGLQFFSSNTNYALVSSSACCIQIMRMDSPTSLTLTYSATALTQRHRQIDITPSQTRAVGGTY